MRASLRPGVTALLAAALCACPSPRAEVPRAVPSSPGLSTLRLQEHGARFEAVVVDLRQAAITLHWKDEDGRPLGDFERLEARLRARGRRLLAATNAGIFEPGLVPTGLHVEAGRVLRPLEQADGEGNFFLLPNGVFALAADGAHLLPTAEAAARLPSLREATQSGPLLVSRGRLHPALGRGSSSRYVRNAVGLRSPHEVVLAFAVDPVNLWTLATVMRERLGCPDALYLDGAISGLWAPALGRRRVGGPRFAGLIAVTTPE